jgi:hypothetical protein
MTLIGVNDFVRRQTYESQYTHFDGSWEELAALTEQAYRRGDYYDGYRAGVWLVWMPPEVVARFYTYNEFPIFEGMKLEAVCKTTAGWEHEPPKIQVLIREPKIRCRHVDIVIYSRNVLLEDHKEDELTGAQWEIVSINGRYSRDPLPMDPMTIVRNWKHLPGGTEMKGAKPEDVLEQLCKAIMHKNGFNYPPTRGGDCP